jgi:uncharacterized membrane protein YccC
MDNLGKWLGARLKLRRIHFALSLRVTLAAVVALVAAQLAGLPLPLWSVLTAVIVTQMSVGRTLKASIDYMLGTIGGSIYGGAVAVLIPHATELALLAVLVIAVAPLALYAALRPGMNVVPISAIIVLLVPVLGSASRGTPIDSAVNRILEVALGALVGLLVSALVVPSSAHRLTRQAAAGMLEQMAAAILDLMAGVRDGLELVDLYRVQDAIGVTLIELNMVGSEAERERSARLSSEADTGPLRRTLLRLRHDLIILGRAAGTPISDAMRARLRPRLVAVETTASDFMRACAAALRARHGPPPLGPFEEALEAYDAEVEAMRHEGLTRALPGDAAERFFAVGFAFEQMRQNLRDLVRVIDEWGPGEHVTGELRPQ